MAVRLEVADGGVAVRLSGVDAVAALSRGLFLPFERIVGTRVMVRGDAVASGPRLPCPGLWWPGGMRSGCWGWGERRQLWCVRRGGSVLVVYLAGRPFHRLVVEVDDPGSVHRDVDAALLRSKIAAARRTVSRRDPRPSTWST